MDKNMRRFGSVVARRAVPPAAHAVAEALQKPGALAQFLEPLGADLRRIEPGALGQQREALGCYRVRHRRLLPPTHPHRSGSMAQTERNGSPPDPPPRAIG